MVVSHNLYINKKKFKSTSFFYKIRENLNRGSARSALKAWLYIKSKLEKVEGHKVVKVVSHKCHIDLNKVKNILIRKLKFAASNQFLYDILQL